MSEWQPIETAPKDGREIVMTMGGMHNAVGHWLTDRAWMQLLDGTANEPAWFPLENPTHWMPLPPPPKIDP